MKLSDLKFNTNYNSYGYDLVEEFYIKALSSASNYDRVSAFFDSKILSLYATGIENIFKNGGKIRFIFSQQLSESDYLEMCSGYYKRSLDLLANNFNHNLLSEMDKKRLSNLSFLIEKGIVDIKIAFTKAGILHDKFGLIYDDVNCLYFRGSNNETVAAIRKNYEKFEVSCTWDGQELENKKVKNAQTEFDNMWNDRVAGVRTIEIPDIIKKEIAKYNSGSLILEQNILESNCVYADLSDKGTMFVEDKLDVSYDFEKDFDYKNYIRKHVSEVKDKIIFFKDDLSYVMMDKIISHFKTSSLYANYEFVVSRKLEDYIESRNIQIEKRKELGKLIKKQDSFVIPEFNKFKTIVNQEMERPLREKQMWDAFFIKAMKKSANYSVPGAGKTSIVYGAFSYLSSSEINRIDRIVMIGPKNSFKSWKDEFKKCFGEKKQLKLLNIQDSKYRNSNERVSALRFDSKDSNLILINYDMLPNLVDVLLEIIDGRTLLVYDEIHKVKAISGVWSSAALKVCKNAIYKVALTGTPLPNSYADLYNQLNILFTDEYRTFFKFSVSDLNNANDVIANKINESIYPFFCRTTKKQLDVPEPNTDEKIISYMTNDEQKLFSLLRRKYSRNGLELYIRLLQASTNPKLLLKNIDYNDINGIFFTEEEENNEFNSGYKLDRCTSFNYSKDEELVSLINSLDMTSKFWCGIDLIEKLVAEGKQVIVWGIFVDTINRIDVELQKRGVLSKIIYGGVDLDEREKRIEDFKAKKFNVLITNPHTLAESVSLHETCHDAIYFEYSFNLTHMLQSRDRINRLGLKEYDYTQYYYLFLCSQIPEEDSIDLRTYDRLEEKKEVMLKSIEGEVISSINFDVIDDLRIILGKD